MTSGRADPPASANSNPFLDPARVRGDLYTDSRRLSDRTTALKRAKVAGRDAASVIADLARTHLSWDDPADGTGRPKRIMDVGCGRATSTVALRAAFPAAQIAMMDLSHQLLSAARARPDLSPLKASAVQADFNDLPLPDGSCDLIVAAFCLYHSAQPANVIAEFSRCLGAATADRRAVIVVTKSSDSYRELDHLVASAGLDEHAQERASLYESASSENITALVGSVLPIQEVVHETHTFRFENLSHAADYVATIPKYRLPDHLRGRADRIRDVLSGHLADQPITATSTVTYVVASARAPAPGDATGPKRAAV